MDLKKDIFISLLISIVFSIILLLILHPSIGNLPLHKEKIKDVNIQQTAINECISLCNTQKNIKKDICLSDEFDFNTKDWSCSINKECILFKKKIVHHTVSLDKNCRLIKIR